MPERHRFEQTWIWAKLSIQAGALNSSDSRAVALSAGLSTIQRKVQGGIDCFSSTDKRAPLSAWTLRAQKSGQNRAPPGVRSAVLGLPLPYHPTARPSHLTGSQARASSRHPPGLPAPGGARQTRHALNPNRPRHFGLASIHTGKEGIYERHWGLQSLLPQQEGEDSVGRLNLANF